LAGDIHFGSGLWANWLCGGRSLHRGLEPAYYAADDLDLPRRGFEPISCVTSNHPPRSHVLTDFTCSPWWYTQLRATQVICHTEFTCTSWWAHSTWCNIGVMSDIYLQSRLQTSMLSNGQSSFPSKAGYMKRRWN
jgi:hypothetical protein